jgi:hypothetical protein
LEKTEMSKEEDRIAQLNKEEDRIVREYAVGDEAGVRALLAKYERLANFFRRMLGEKGSAADKEDVEIDPADIGAMDSRGRRVVKPLSAADRSMFEASHGLTHRRIRNLGDN